MKKIFYALAGALALFAVASLLDEHHVFAQQAVPVLSRTKETLTCATPCTVNANNTAIFADTETGASSTIPSKRRSKWTCRNVGAADLYLCKGTTCSSAAYDWLLTAAGKDSYGEDVGTVWAGAISAASTGTTLACAGQL